jgi:hypothetical protein
MINIRRSPNPQARAVLAPSGGVYVGRPESEKLRTNFWRFGENRGGIKWK